MAYEVFGKEHTQNTMRLMRELHDRELTPDEVREITARAMGKIRTALKAKGYDVPDDDKEMFLWMKRMKGESTANWK